MGEQHKITQMQWETDQSVMVQSLTLSIDRWIAANPGKVLDLSLSEHKRNRTTVQNSKIWAMIRHINRNQCWGVSDENAKNILTAECFGSKEVNGHEVYCSTSQLTVEQMSKFIEWMERYSAENGIPML